MYAAAVNRIYYGISYILLALGLLYNFETSKQQQIIGWFNKKFIKEGIIEKNMDELFAKHTKVELHLITILL